MDRSKVFVDKDYADLQRLMEAEDSGSETPALYVDDLIRLSRAGYLRVDSDGTAHITSSGRRSVHEHSSSHTA